MSAEFDIARANMLESQVRTADVTDLSIQEAIRLSPRHQLTPSGRAHLAYADTEIEYAPGLWMLKPRDIAKLLQGLLPIAGESALAIAAPYGAMLLRQIGLQVTEIGASEGLPIRGGGFDLAISEGAVGAIPTAWIDALVIGGRLGVVVREGPVGRAMRVLRTQDGVGTRTLFDATPPFMDGFEPKASFAF